MPPKPSIVELSELLSSHTSMHTRTPSLAFFTSKSPAGKPTSQLVGNITVCWGSQTMQGCLHHMALSVASYKLEGALGQTDDWMHPSHRCIGVHACTVAVQEKYLGSCKGPPPRSCLGPVSTLSCHIRTTLQTPAVSTAWDSTLSWIQLIEI